MQLKEKKGSIHEWFGLSNVAVPLAPTLSPRRGRWRWRRGQHSVSERSSGKMSPTATCHEARLGQTVWSTESFRLIEESMFWLATFRSTLFPPRVTVRPQLFATSLDWPR